MELSKREQAEFMRCFRVENSFRQEIEFLANEGACHEIITEVIDNAWQSHFFMQYFIDRRLNRVTEDRTGANEGGRR